MRPDLGAHQLGGVGIALLRHDRGAGGEAVGKPHEAELRRHPDHDLLGQPREVHGRDRRRCQRLQGEVAVGDAVERIGGRPIEAQRFRRHVPVDGKRRAGQGGGTQRALVEALARIAKPAAVARQHLHIGQQMVAEGHGLGGLQMREAGHHQVAMRLRLARERELEGGQRRIGAVDPVAHVELEVGRDLVVARAGRVQPPGRLADQLLEPALHVHVHVLERARELEAASHDLLQHLVETGVDLPGVVLGDDTLRRQHRRVRLGGADVLRGQSLVEADGGVYLLHHFCR